jgi:hypothetical protein
MAARRKREPSSYSAEPGFSADASFGISVSMVLGSKGTGAFALALQNLGTDHSVSETWHSLLLCAPFAVQ